MFRFRAFRSVATAYSSPAAVHFPTTSDCNCYCLRATAIATSVPHVPIRTYLEMTSPDDLRPSRVSNPDLRLERIDRIQPTFYRDLYTSVGREYRWTDRLAWTDRDIDAHFANPRVSLHVLYERGAPCGYFELRKENDDAVEIAYFGLLPHAIGRGLGKHLLTLAVEEAWGAGATRVWLHTSTLDHRHALANYQARGFRVVKAEEYGPE